MAKKIGIDLGTTYSCVSYVDEMGVVRVVDNLEGEQTTPSVVFFDPNNGEAVVGSTAKSEGAMSPENIVERVKNYMGDPDYKCYINGVERTAAEVSALILKKLISDAELYLGDDIEGAVITCPAYFGELARFATKSAGESVTLKNGQTLTVLQILDEPTAAAIAYGYSRNEDMNKTILIYDLGGGTFDCTVMKMDLSATQKSMQVITTGGNHQLGGKDWDDNFAELVRQKFCDATGADIDEMRDDAEMKAWFSENIEKAKKNLTNRESTSLTVSFSGNKERIEVTRQEFNDCTSGLLDQTIFLVNDMLEKKGMTINDIDEIILVGGSTFMPQVTERLTAEYGKPISSYEPNKAVAMGAALTASGYEVVQPTEEEIKQAAEEGKKPVQPKIVKGTIGGPGSVGPVVNVVETCTKSYGLRIYQGGNETVLNLIKKDTVKPAHGDASGLVFTDKHELINEVEILILESDSLEEYVSRADCNEIYEEEPIALDGEVYGDNNVSVELDVDIDGIVTLTLHDLVTGKSYKMNPRRRGDAGISEDIKKITLR